MAIDTKEFTEKVATGIKATSDYKKFFFSLIFEGKRKRKILDYSRKAWNKRDLIKEAKKAFIDFEDEVINQSGTNLHSDTKLDVIAAEYFKNETADTRWNKERQRNYELYIKEPLGNLAVSQITLNKMNEIKIAMQKEGKTPQTANGCSATTINNVLVLTLMAILKYAQDNNAIDKIPAFKKLKSKPQKKKVQNGTETLAKLYSAIMSRYADDPYYRAMFLFALYGRRWNEIATLTTNDVDLERGVYHIRAENSKIATEKTFTLPQPIIDALIELSPDNGLVFKSPKTGAKPWIPKKQITKLKEDTDIEDLTMHYFRHVVSTALIEMGETSAVAAATLGHSNTGTTERYYATLNNQKSSSKAVDAVSTLIDAK